MSKTINMASAIHDFFEHYLTSQRGLSPHTILAYRDTIKLLILFVAQHYRKSCTKITIEDFSSDTIKRFLDHLEKVRHNTVKTRNARLAAIHCFFRYCAIIDPRVLIHCQAILDVPFKRYNQAVFDYLERDEILSIFRYIDIQNTKGRRDNALLRLLYNTGMRAQELVDLNINHIRFTRPYYVRIHGKGHKERTCPVWSETKQAIKTYLQDRSVRLTDSLPLFVNAKGQRLSRFGLRYIITARVTTATKNHPTLLTRKITPHTFRHTTAMHLLQSGVDLNMIRSWLGHSSIETTHTYVEIDLDMKRKTLQACEKLLPKTKKHGPSWKRNPGILEWLSNL